MFYDSHIHTFPFSPDSNQNINDCLKALDELGFGGVLTEHIDYNLIEEWDGKTIVFEFNIEEYFKTYGPYRSDRLLLGLELGLQPHCRDKNAIAAASHPWDFILGSMHLIDGLNPYKEGFYKAFSSKTACYKRFLEASLEEITAHSDFDSFTHIDYICRNAPYENKNWEDDHAYKKELTALLKYLADHEKALEVNTRRFDEDAAVQAYRFLLKEFKSLGGKYITIGSDAHDAKSIGFKFKEAVELVYDIGLTPVYYKKRKPTPFTR